MTKKPTWYMSTESAAIARNASMSRKRGFPGGGTSAGDTDSPSDRRTEPDNPAVDIVAVIPPERK